VIQTIYAIIKTHGGEWKVETLLICRQAKEGAGASFTISIPV